MLVHALHVVQSKLREHAKRGNRLAQKITGEAPRSPHWRTIEKRWLSSHDVCACCGGRTRLQVHHIQAFHIHPALELQDGSGVPPATGGPGAPPNLITLCMSPLECHLQVGHGGNFRADGNPRVVEDCGAIRLDPSRRPEIVARARLDRLAA